MCLNLAQSYLLPCSGWPSISQLPKEPTRARKPAEIVQTERQIEFYRAQRITSNPFEPDSFISYDTSLLSSPLFLKMVTILVPLEAREIKDTWGGRSVSPRGRYKTFSYSLLPKSQWARSL